jgi:hypothetical protein
LDGNPTRKFCSLILGRVGSRVDAIDELDANGNNADNVLSISSWIYYGLGNLYGSPFVTRCLLYRLHDIDCSILVYHKPNVTSGPSKVIKNEFGSIVHMTSVCHEVTEVYVHYTNSSTVALSKLIDSSPIQLELSDKTSPRCVLGGINVILERFQLPCTEMFSAFPSNGQFEQQISKTPYWVKGPVAVVNMGKQLEEKTESAQETKMRCWKLSVGNLSKKEYYDIGTSRKWSLAALNIEQDWKVTSAMYLEKRA